MENLLNVNVNEYTEKKNGLTYLSWANAWREFIKVNPNAIYKIDKTVLGLPYFGSDEMGYMVYTRVTVGEITHEMWLPVLDYRNKTMKAKPYEYKDKYNKTKTVEAVNMFDVNTAIMRCLTKNLAMFGLGLYIYAGEDIPQDSEANTDNVKKKVYEKDEELLEKYVTVKDIIDNNNLPLGQIESYYQNTLDKMSLPELTRVAEDLEKRDKK